MALRFAKLPIVACACLIAGVVIGLMLAPASAQQMLSGIDGQVAVRSDYAVYLISNGQRRWISTVLITDEEINAYPEAEPIYSGVTPLPPQPGQAVPPPVPSAAPSPAPAPYPTPVGATGEIDPNLPIEVDIDGQAIFEQGNQIAVVVKAKAGASCELTVRWPNATEEAQPPQIADARGRCSFSIRVPSNVPNGLGFLKGSVREGGRVSNQSVEFQIVDDV